MIEDSHIWFLEYIGIEKPTLKELFDATLDRLGISMLQAEKVLGIEKKSLNAILNGDAKRTDVLNLLKLSEFLNIKDSDIFKIYAAELPGEVITELVEFKKRLSLVSTFNIKLIKKSIGLIDSVNDFEGIENSLLGFFGYKTLDEYNQNIGVAFSRRPTRYNRMLDFWTKAAYSLLDKVQNPNPYDRDAMKDIVSKIKPYTKDEAKGFEIVAKALFQVGVTVVFQPYLSRTNVRGATFIINDHPSIVITDLGKMYCQMWETLLHELYHVLFDYEEIKARIFHLTGEPDLYLLDEGAADDFAREMILPSHKLSDISKFINNDFMILDLAQKERIHPSFIYFYYCTAASKAGKELWGIYRNKIPNADMRTMGFPSIFDSKSVEKAAVDLQRIFHN